MIKKFVEIITDFQAIHNWPECPFDEVDFLKYPHRHKIIIIVKIEIINDRQIEFFLLKNKIDDIINYLFGKERTKKIGSISMEEISTKIINNLCEEYSKSYIEVSASEDGQVRGIAEYAPTKR